jgi:hypothetical protein
LRPRCKPAQVWVRLVREDRPCGDQLSGVEANSGASTSNRGVAG